MIVVILDCWVIIIEVLYKIDDFMVCLEIVEKFSSELIVVIGMGCWFLGGVNNFE